MIKATGEEDARGLTIGDRAPNFVLPDESGRFVMFYERTQGRPVVLLLVPEPEAPHSHAVLTAIRAQYETLKGLGIDIYCLQGGSAGQQSPHSNDLSADDFLVWRDPAGKILEAYWGGLGVGSGDGGRGAEDRVVALILDANQRILNVLASQDETLAGQVREFFSNRPPSDDPVLRRSTAPVLIIPNLLSCTWCDWVLTGWADQSGPVRRDAPTASLPTAPTGALSAPGLTSPAPSPIERPLSPELARPLQGLIGRRLAPELQKAFSFGTFRLGAMAAVCRKPVLGEFQAIAPTSPETSGASRCFTLMVNITPHTEPSSDPAEPESGLVFPEYGPDSFWPRRGGAVIFASDLLVRWKAASGLRCCYIRADLRG